MEIILQDDELRQRIINKVKPIKKSPHTFLTMNLLTAVYDEESGITYTCTYYLTEWIRRSGNHFTEYTFILLDKDREYMQECLYYTDVKNYEIRGDAENLPVSKEKFLEMVRYYFDNQGQWRQMEAEEVERLGDGVETYTHTEWYLNQNYFGQED